MEIAALDRVNKYGESDCYKCGGEAQYLAEGLICLGCSMPPKDCDCDAP